MSTEITAPIINDPAEFIAQQYAALSPNWDALTGREQLEILKSHNLEMTSSTVIKEGKVVLGPHTEDHLDKQAAIMLVKHYIARKSNYDPEVKQLLGYEEIFVDEEVA